MNRDSSPLKDFKAIEAEPEPPEPLWKRLYSYLFLMALLGGLFSGVVFLQQSGVFSRGNRLAKENLKNVDESNARIYLFTKIAGALGAGVGLVISIKSELRKK